MVGRTSAVYAVGCKGDKSLEKELSGASVDIQQSLLLDCNDFQDARDGVQWHWGASTKAISTIMQTDKASLKMVFKMLRNSLSKRNETISNLVLFL